MKNIMRFKCAFLIILVLISVPVIGEAQTTVKTGSAVQEAAEKTSLKLSKSVPSRCRIVGITEQQAKAQPYLLRQLIQNVGGAKGICQVSSTGAVLIKASGTGASCPVYKGPNNLGATAGCPTATVTKDVLSGKETIICPKRGSACAETSSKTLKEDPNKAPCQKLIEAYNIDHSTLLGRIKYSLIASVIIAANGDVPCDEFGNPIQAQKVSNTVVDKPSSAKTLQNTENVFKGKTIEKKVANTTPFKGGKIVEKAAPVQTNTADGSALDRYVKGNTVTSNTKAPAVISGEGNKVIAHNGNPSITGAGARDKTPVGQNIQQGQNRYRSLNPPQSFAKNKPQSFIQRFTGRGSIADNLANFVTGGQAQLRNTPEGDSRGGVQPQVVYVTPEFVTPATINREFRSIQDIASDISSQTSGDSFARVDHFARTLNAVGGPGALDTENKSFGRIQDLIVEDEAIRALRVAEEEGKRAKNSVFCRATDTSEECKERREEKAEEVERRVFTQELEKRVLPDSAIQHFLAVYDGWVRPSPAPKTRATSTLAVLSAQDDTKLADYEITTGGSNFVLWMVDSLADATVNAVSKFTGLFTGDSETATSTPSN